MKKQLFLALLACLGQWVSLPAIELQQLKVEYASCPIGIDTNRPRFSWQMKADEGERNIRQTAYQLWVYDESGACTWNSGKILDGKSLHIAYGGKPLQPATAYEWKLCAWTQTGEELSASSHFETGLMAQKDTDPAWNGAKWIGGGDEDLPLYSHYLPVFRLNYVFRLDSLSRTTTTAFVYGANDERLMDANKNLFGIANKRNESYIKVELNADSLQEGKDATVKVFRIGFCPTDQPHTPFATFRIPLQLLNPANRYQEHTLSLTTNLGTTEFFFDKETKAIGKTNLNPIGEGGDFIAFPVVGDVGFYQPEGQTPTAIRLEIGNYRSPANLLTTITPPLPIMQKPAKGTLYLVNPSRNAAPMLRTIFSTHGKKVAKARLYVTARGIYDFYLNGKRVGNDYFNPGLTQYNKTHLYQTFDVTPYIREGENAAGAILSEGWWSGGATFTGNNWNYFGDRQSLLAQIALTYEDGTEEYIVTRPDTWKFYGEGPVMYGSFFQGEVYDARREQQVTGWSTTSYDDHAWKAAQEVPLQGNVSLLSELNSPNVYDYSQYHLTGQSGQTVTTAGELTAQSVEEVRPGIFVYDMGQNMVGVPRITLTGCHPGQRINLRYAEVKYPDLPEYAGHTGMIMLENIRAAMAQDIYIARGGQETIAPRFTYHGYRFVEITGIDRPLPLEAVKGTVLSSVDRLLSHYETSNPKVNKLWENITWSTYGNFLSIPTDCPQRNERMGWAGDISVFSRTATYLTDASQFLRRYLRSMRDVQRKDGRFADIAPLGGGFGGILWGSAGITVPWECYMQYDDKALLNEHYPAMKRYIQYLLDQCVNPDTHILDQGASWWGNLSDWLGPEDQHNDATLLWEAYFIYDLDIMRQTATLLNHPEDASFYARLYQERKAFFNRTYIDPATGKTRSADGKRLVDTQTSYVLPLAFHIVADSMRQKVTDALVNTLTRENRADNGVVCPPYSLMTGFIGTAWISRTLSDYGRNDVAYRLLQQTTYPSWLYSIEQGATTIWERLNSYTHTDGFGGNNRMNSFNHYSFGAVGAWMYNCSLGIQPDPQSPGFKHFFLKPVPDPTGEMTYARGYYDSMYGRIESGWEITPEAVRYTFTIPANTTATICLPAGGTVMLDGKKLKQGRDYQTENGHVRMELASGTYRFEIKHPSKAD